VDYCYGGQNELEHTESNENGKVDNSMRAIKRSWLRLGSFKANLIKGKSRKSASGNGQAKAKQGKENAPISLKSQ
jgi:hypothetical protein